MEEKQGDQGIGRREPGEAGATNHFAMRAYKSRLKRNCTPKIWKLFI